MHVVMCINANRGMIFVWHLFIPGDVFHGLYSLPSSQKKSILIASGEWHGREGSSVYLLQIVGGEVLVTRRPYHGRKFHFVDGVAMAVN